MVEAITEMSAQDQGPAPTRGKESYVTTAEIVALATALPAIIGAVTALVVALRSHGAVQAHIRKDH